jgi:N-sulfoglucosamine sulfohydrolase
LLDYAGVDIRKYDFHGKSFKGLFDGNVTRNYDTIFASHTFHAVQQYYPMRMIKTRKYKLIWNLVHGQTYPLWGVDSFLELIHKHDLKKIGKRPVEDLIFRPAFELYDMEKDPNEINNLANHAEYQEVLERLKNELFRFQERTNDPWKGFEKFIKLEEAVKTIKKN